MPHLLPFSLPLLAILSLGSGEFDVVINEIHYHPFGNDPGDEFVELHNRGARAVDLSGWRIEGGISINLPQGTLLPGGGYLVLSPDPVRTAKRYGVPAALVLGAWAGQLDNDGDSLVLADQTGRRIARTRYRDGAGWPEAPDGFGPSLELVSPRFDFDFPESWAASVAPGGTPGARNSRFFSNETSRAVLVRPADPVRFFRGVAEPSPAEPLGWTSAGFDAGLWESGPGPLGFGVAGLGTTLADMQGGYSAVYARVEFSLTADDLAGLNAGKTSLVATVRYDDGFLAYVQGAEVFRVNVPGAAGEPVPFDGVAAGSEQSAASFDLSKRADLLSAGRNVLALQGFNRDKSQSGDFLLEAMIERIERSSPGAGVRPLKPVVNEVGAAPGQGFVEIYNPSSALLDLSGFQISRDPYAPAPFRFPAETQLEPRAFFVVAGGDLGGSIPAVPARWLILAADGAFVSGLDAQLGPEAPAWGRYPDGEEDAFALAGPSPGAANRVALVDSVIINEIHYHPQDTRGEFIELHNRSGEAVSLTGWRFTRGLDYALPAGTSIPAGGFLVVAGDPDWVRSQYGLPSEGVVGGFLSRLANDAETIRLEDTRGNPVDEVRYADDGSWPGAADGTGKTLELINPALANETGSSWAAGPPGGTPLASNAAWQAAPPPVVFEVRHQPAVPRNGEPILVEARASAVWGVRRVLLDYRTERGQGQGQVELHDDGLSGDGPAGDGRYGGVIPAPVAQNPNLPARVVFTVTAEDESGGRATFPGAGRSFLFEISDDELTGNGAPRYRLIMTSANWNALRTRGSGSDDLLDATFIADGEVVYNAGLRFRGNGARNPPDNRYSYRVQLSDERRFHGIRKLNLNSQRIWSQVLGTDLVRRSGCMAPQFWPANVWIDGVLDADYLRMEAIDADFLDRNFPVDASAGNLYRARRGGGGRQGDLQWYGANPAVYMDSYEKLTNEEAADWSDVLNLSNLLTNTPDANFVSAVRAAIDVEEWCLYFALYTVLGSTETGIYRDDGDDYFLYRRSSDGRWMLFPWDQDSDFTDTETTTPMFRPSSPPVRRFLTHPEFAPIYYCLVEELVGGPFSLPEMVSRLPLASELAAPGTLASVETYVADRIRFLAGEIPAELTAGVTSPGQPSGGGDLVRAGDAFQYFEGRAAPPDDWMSPAFDDGAWKSGASPLGQGYPDLGTTVQVQDQFLTLYARRRFTVSDPAALPPLTLLLGYDDGFVAYLNGFEVARKNLGAADQPVRFDAIADAGHDAYPRESISIPSSALQDGENVLAFAVANNRLGSGDFLLDPILRAGEVTAGATGGGCGDRLHGFPGTIRLEGRAPACAARSVLVNGEAARFTPVGVRWSADVDLEPGTNVISVEALDGAGARLAKVDVAIEGDAGFRAVSGTLAGGAVWTAAGGPYFVSSNLDVPAGARLQITPGASVIVAPGAAITVRGELVVEGVPDSLVTFQPIHCGASWAGIHLVDTGAGGVMHRLRHVRVLNAGEGGGAALQLRAASAEVIGAEIQGPGGPAVSARDSRLHLEDCRLANVGGGLNAIASTVVLRRCQVASAPVRGPAVRIEGDGPDASQLEDLDVSSPLDAGVVLINCAAALSRSRIHDCAGEAVSVSGGSPRLAGNLLVRSRTGLSVQAGQPVAEHLTVTENEIGIEAAGGVLRVSSSIVWGNTTDLDAGRGEAAFAFSDVGRGEAPAGQGNIAADPLFASLDRYDLSTGSPAIAAGENGTDMGAVSASDSGSRFVRGDYNLDQEVNLSDPIVLLSYLFLSGPAGSCEDAGDVDDTGLLDLSDAVWVIAYLFLAGPPPPEPFPVPGLDRTPDALTCLR